MKTNSIDVGKIRAQSRGLFATRWFTVEFEKFKAYRVSEVEKCRRVNMAVISGGMALIWRGRLVGVGYHCWFFKRTDDAGCTNDWVV
jgi:hypothetical protein